MAILQHFSTLPKLARETDVGMTRDGYTLLKGIIMAQPVLVGPQTDTYWVRYTRYNGVKSHIVTGGCRNSEIEFLRCSEPGNRANHHY